MGFTKERIRQLENKSIRKFRNPRYRILFLNPSVYKKDLKAEEEMVAEDAMDILTNTEKILEVKFFGVKTATEILQFLESETMANTDCSAAKEILEEFIRKRKESLDLK